MEDRDAFLADVRYRLEQVQQVQKRHYDRLHRPVSYQVGDWVLLCIRQRPAASIPQELLALGHCLGHSSHSRVPRLIRPDGRRVVAVDHPERRVAQ